MSFKSLRINLVNIVFGEIEGLQKQCDSVMLGRIDATIRGTYFAKSLTAAEFLTLRNLTLGFIFRKLNERIASLADYGVDVAAMFSWLPATAEEFIAQLEVEYAEEPAP